MTNLYIRYLYPVYYVSKHGVQTGTNALKQRKKNQTISDYVNHLDADSMTGN